MVGASDFDSNSTNSTLSSSGSEDEGDRCKNKMAPKNLSRLSCFARDFFYNMAHSSNNKKSQKDDSYSDFEDEVRDELSFLRQENEELGKLLDNRDDSQALI
jgi:hypothetical protein